MSPTNTHAALSEIAAERILVLDGAMGTMGQACEGDEEGVRGERFAEHSHDLRGNTDVLSLTRPELVASIHHRFLAAGADLLTTNTVNTNAIAQADYGLKAHVGELNRAAAELAPRYDLPILVAASFRDDVPGTLIRKQVQMEPSNRVRGIALEPDVALITIRAVPDRPGIASQVFGPLADAGINVATIVQNASAERLTDLTFSVAHDQAEAAHGLCREGAGDLGAGEVILDEHAAKVSIVGTGMQSGVGYAAKMFHALAGADVNIELISTSEIRITAIVHEDDGKNAVQVLHAAFELDDPAPAGAE